MFKKFKNCSSYSKGKGVLIAIYYNQGGNSYWVDFTKEGTELFKIKALQLFNKQLESL